MDPRYEFSHTKWTWGALFCVVFVPDAEFFYTGRILVLGPRHISNDHFVTIRAQNGGLRNYDFWRGGGVYKFPCQ